MRSNCDTTSESIEMLDDRKKKTVTMKTTYWRERERSSESDRVSESAIARVSEREKKGERDVVC